MNLLSGKNWYALHVRANQERNTAKFLSDRDVTFFLPSYHEVSKRSDRRVKLEKPLFPGYVFIRVDYRQPERVEALKAPGAVRIVAFGENPMPIDEATMESLRILVDGSENAVRPHPLIRVGHAVRITDGPFAGARGILNETSDRNPHLVVEIELLGRAVSVPISLDQTAPDF